MIISNKSDRGILVVFTLIITAALFAASCGDSGKKTSSATGPVIDSVAASDGLMIHYEVVGDSPQTVVLIHGWGGDRTYWKYQIPYLKKKYTVVAIDLAGHGESGLKREHWTISSLGADVAAVINKLDLDKFVLIGHSMGGAVIIEAALHFPDKVLGLVGVDTFQDLGSHHSEEAINAFFAPLEKDFSGRDYGVHKKSLSCQR